MQLWTTGIWPERTRHPGRRPSAAAAFDHKSNKSLFIERALRHCGAFWTTYRVDRLDEFIEKRSAVFTVCNWPVRGDSPLESQYRVTAPVYCVLHCTDPINNTIRRTDGRIINYDQTAACRSVDRFTFRIWSSDCEPQTLAHSFANRIRLLKKTGCFSVCSFECHKESEDAAVHGTLSRLDQRMAIFGGFYLQSLVKCAVEVPFQRRKRTIRRLAKPRRPLASHPTPKSKASIRHRSSRVLQSISGVLRKSVRMPCRI